MPWCRTIVSGIGIPGAHAKGFRLNRLYTSEIAARLGESSLILLGHGTTLNPDSARSVLRHSEALRERGLFGEVLPVFWKQPPAIKEVLHKVAFQRVYIVPMFVSEGYFSSEAIPKELGLVHRAGLTFVTEREGKSICYTGPIGTHSSMTRVVLSRAEEVVRQFPLPQTPPPGQMSLLVAGHGTRRNRNSRRSVEEQVGILRSFGKYAAVQGIFMEEAPFIKDYLSLFATDYAIVVPYFMGEGLHVQEDIPVLLGERATVVRERLAAGQSPWRNPTMMNGKQIWYSQSVGTHSAVADVIIGRVAEAMEASPGI